MTETSIASVPIRLKRFPHHEGLELPSYRSIGASGMDLSAAVTDDVVLKPGERALIPTGIAMVSCTI